MADVITMKVVYEGCDNRIWRTMKISSKARLADLAYAVLAAFDGKGYHLFHIEHEGILYKLPMRDERLPLNRCVYLVTMSDLKLMEGSRLTMIYDYGLDQEFTIEILGSEPMGRGQGGSYPKIIDGAGWGMLEDVPAPMVLELIKETDETGQCSFMFGNPPFEKPWDYRRFDVKNRDALVRGKAKQIKMDYEEPF